MASRLHSSGKKALPVSTSKMMTPSDQMSMLGLHST